MNLNEKTLTLTYIFLIYLHVVICTKGIAKLCPYEITIKECSSFYYITVIPKLNFCKKNLQSHSWLKSICRLLRRWHRQEYFFTGNQDKSILTANCKRDLQFHLISMELLVS